MHPDKATNDSSVEKPSNVNYEADMKHTMRYTRWLLQLLGLWPIISEDSSKMAKHFSKILIPFCLVIPTFMIVQVGHYMLVREKNIIVQFELSLPVIFYSSNFLKYIIILYRYDAIKLCLKYLKNDWMKIESEEDREIMMRNLKFGHRLTLICVAITYTHGVIFYALAPLLTGKQINKFNETVRVFAYPGFDMFVDSNISPNYEIILLIICITVTVIYSVNTTVCSLGAVFVSHVCGQIEILMARLGTFVDESCEDRCNDEEHDCDNRISFVIQYHVRTLRLSAIIEMVLREMCLIEVIASAIYICLLEYIIMTTWSKSNFMNTTSNVIALMGVAFSIFILCHVGEVLTEKFRNFLILLNYESARIGESAYMIDWYKLPGKSGLALIMVMSRCNNPGKLTAGKMMDLSIFNFGRIIKTSFAYLNMLRTITVQ